ncbi:sensor histidine kinase [Raoultibacter phocaeensis]|uniref:sensor histidine kinase n=1 Tax=Raoultibacter phocaeensis TaxID=2479841 RepID=UPI00111944D8|nr:HAMP domain-containing sensor histidine kinase [Raoultibacter phocaeensis]
MEALVAIIVVLVGAIIVLAIQLVRSERELRAFARFLNRRDSSSNARTTTSVHTRGFVQLGQAINRQLDRHQGERIAADEHAAEMRRGLTYLSHDIRTPLAGAKGYAQLLEGEIDPAVRQRYLEAIDRRIDDASKLLDQLFAFAQVQDPDYRLEREPLDANEVLAETLASLYPQFQERGWTPAIDLADEELTVLADADALERTFRNLAVNALRYGAAAPTITQRGCAITFANRVADPASLDVERLFERFYQGGEVRADGSGGLGLAIVSQLCRAMGATARATLEGDLLAITVEFEA